MAYANEQPPKVEQLEPRLLLSGISDLLSSATDLSVPTPADIEIAECISQAKESDVYRFSAAATSQLVIDMIAETGGLDPTLRLYDSKGNCKRKNNNASRGTKDSTISYMLDPGQTYYIRARGRRKTTGQYRLRIRTELVDDFGNALADAEAIRLSRSGRKRIRGAIDYGSDADVLLFVARRSGTMTVRQYPKRRRQPIDCLLYAYDAEGNLLASNEQTIGQTKKNTIIFGVAQGQTYYLQVDPYQESTGKYKLKIKTKKGPPPSPSPQPEPQPAPSPEPQPQPQPEPDPTPQPQPQPEPEAVPQIAPRERMAVQATETEEGWQLHVLGTNRDDTIVVAQNAGGITVSGQGFTENLSREFLRVTIYSFGGNDAIRLTNSVAATEIVFAGDGDDQIFDASAGRGQLHGGEGDDLLISIGGGSDSLSGDGGLDSYWVDALDEVSDASQAEREATALHRVAEFHQPYTTDPDSPDYVPLTIAGQDLRDPSITSYANGYRSFAGLPVFADGPSYDDVVQGALGDCYLLASLASLAESDPVLVEQMIAPLGDGTFAVRFYDDNTPIYLRVDADLPVRWTGSLVYAKLGPDGEVWMPLIEKAYACFRRGQNSYASLDGGWMSYVLQQATGRGTLYRSASYLGQGLYSFLANQLASGHAVTMGSDFAASAPIVPGHAYMVVAVWTDETGQYVQVYNPWGVDGAEHDENPYDGLLTLTTSEFARYLPDIVASVA